MNTPLPILSGPRLQLWSIFREAFVFPWQYRHMLWKWIVVCGVLVGLTNFASEILNATYNPEADGLFELSYHLALIVFQVAFTFSLFTVFCIRCHRLALLGSMPEADVFPPQFGERERTFIRFLFIIFLLFSFAGIVFVFISGVLVVFGLSSLLGISDTRYEEWIHLPLLMIPAAYLTGRFCMVFPATAIDLQPSLKWAREQSKDFAWRLGILVGFLPCLFSFIYNDAKLFFGLDEYPFSFSLITGLLWFALITIEVALLSIAFRELSGLAIRNSNRN